MRQTGCGLIRNLKKKEDDTEKKAKKTLAEDKRKSAAKALDGDPATAVLTGSKTGTLELDFGGAVTFDTVILKKGWNIRKYHLDALIGEQWQTIYIGDRIEDLRYCALETPVTASKLRLIVDSANQVFSISEIEVAQTAKSKNDAFRVSAYVRTEK